MMIAMFKICSTLSFPPTGLVHVRSVPTRGSVTRLIIDLPSDDPAVRDLAARLVWQRYFHELLLLTRSHLPGDLEPLPGGANEHRRQAHLGSPLDERHNSLCPLVIPASWAWLGRSII